MQATTVELDYYEERCAEIFITKSRNLVVDCLLCENRTALSVEEFLRHMEAQHLQAADEEDKNIELTQNDLQFDDVDDIIAKIDCDDANVLEEPVLEWLSVDAVADAEEKEKELVQQFAVDDDETFINNFKMPKKRTQNEITRRQCYKCGAIIKWECNYNAHMRRHTNVRPYKCTHCARSFYTGPELTIHLRRHNQEKPYICQECGKQFITQANLTEHLKRHLNLRAFTCTKCSKSFYNAAQLKEHEVGHSEIKNFVCNICQRAFARQKSLLNHSRIHENAMAHKCELCDAAFNQRGSLIAHCKSRHKMLKAQPSTFTPPEFDFNQFCEYKCDICGILYNNKRRLDIHMKRHSNVETPNTTTIDMPNL